MEASSEYSEEQVEKAKSLSLFNLGERRKKKPKGTKMGWKEDKALPSGWMFKMKTNKLQNRLMVKAPGVKMFESVKRAVRFMEASNEFSIEQVEMAKGLALINMNIKGITHKLGSKK